MRPADVIRLVTLAAIWGGSFIFIRVSARALGAIATVETRVVVAAIVLLLWALATKSKLELRERWKHYLAIGILNSAIPFTLISWSEVRLTASMAAILNATTPLFGAMVAAVWLKDRLTAMKVAGIVVAFAGVTLLVGWSPLVLDGGTTLAIAASLGGALSYGVAATYAKVCAKGAPPMGLAIGSQASAAIILGMALPFALPQAAPSPAVVANVLALALLCTAIGYLLFFRLLVDVGPIRTLSVTFLVPLFGMLWGFLFMGEAVTWTKALACSMILLGTSLVVGLVKSRRLVPAT